MKNKIKALAGAVLLAALLAVLLLWQMGEGGSASFQVHFIDVGQGDCALVLCGGRSMLVDGGNIGDGQKIVDYLKAQGVESLDYLVASHPHADHIGGLPYVIDNMEVSAAFISPYIHTSGIYEQLIDGLYDSVADTQMPSAGFSFELGGAWCTFVGDGAGFEDANNSSLALMVEYGGDSVLFTGDMEAQQEQALLAGGARLDCTLLKVAHHGSDTSSTEGFLQAASPEIAVISVGDGNSYGHPSSQVLKRLSVCRVYRTDLEGTLVFGSEGEGFFRQEEGGFCIYLGNAKSGVYHRLSCESLPSLGNIRLIFGRRQAGNYRPCGRCQP